MLSNHKHITCPLDKINNVGLFFGYHLCMFYVFGCGSCTIRSSCVVKSVYSIVLI